MEGGRNLKDIFYELFGGGVGEGIEGALAVLKIFLMIEGEEEMWDEIEWRVG